MPVCNGRIERDSTLVLGRYWAAAVEVARRPLILGGEPAGMDAATWLGFEQDVFDELFAHRFGVSPWERPFFPDELVTAIHLSEHEAIERPLVPKQELLHLIGEHWFSIKGWTNDDPSHGYPWLPECLTVVARGEAKSLIYGSWVETNRNLKEHGLAFAAIPRHISWHGLRVDEDGYVFAIVRRQHARDDRRWRRLTNFADFRRWLIRQEKMRRELIKQVDAVLKLELKMGSEAFQNQLWRERRFKATGNAKKARANTQRRKAEEAELDRRPVPTPTLLQAAAQARVAKRMKKEYAEREKREQIRRFQKNAKRRAARRYARQHDARVLAEERNGASFEAALADFREHGTEGWWEYEKDEDGNLVKKNPGEDRGLTKT